MNKDLFSLAGRVALITGDGLDTWRRQHHRVRVPIAVRVKLLQT